MVRLAVAQAPREAAYLDSLGWVEYKRGQFEQAAEWLRRALRWRKNDPTLLDHAGDAAFRLGRIDDAKARWREATEAVTDPKRGTPDADDEVVRRRAHAKLAAVNAGGMPEVAPWVHEIA